MSDIQQLIRRGKEAFDHRDYAAALTDFQEVLRRNPRFADIQHLSGLCLSFLGHPDEALAAFDEAIALNERYVEAHINRAITLNELGRFNEGREAFAHAARLENEAGGRFPAAIAARLAIAHGTLGDLYIGAAATAEAVQQYRAALEIRPLFHDIRVKLAQALLAEGDLSSAAAELRTVLASNPRALAARLNLGLVHFRAGDIAAAQREWEMVRAQQPGDAQVRAYLSMLEQQNRPHPEPPR